MNNNKPKSKNQSSNYVNSGWFYDKKGNIHTITTSVKPVTQFGGIPNNSGSGKTGDIDFTTVGHSNGDSYSIILVLTKNF